MSESLLWIRLQGILESLSNDDQFEVFEHAKWLLFHSRLVGGPLDGFRVPVEFKGHAGDLAIKYRGKVAVYKPDGFHVFRFCSLAPIGGEGGYWPDFDAEQCSQTKGGDA
jgi:hypothetical protein